MQSLRIDSSNNKCLSSLSNSSSWCRALYRTQALIQISHWLSSKPTSRSLTLLIGPLSLELEFLLQLPRTRQRRVFNSNQVRPLLTCKELRILSESLSSKWILHSNSNSFKLKLLCQTSCQQQMELEVCLVLRIWQQEHNQRSNLVRLKLVQEDLVLRVL